MKRSRPVATMAEVARLAAVSTATVSRTLAGGARVSPSTRARVMRAVEELDYQPSHLARNLRARTARIIGLVIGDVGNPFFTAIVRGCEDVAQQSGYSLVLANTDEDPERELAALRVMAGERASGVILVSTGAVHDGISRLIAAGVGVVALDRRIPGSHLDTVVTDNASAASDATRHLLELGHQRIAIIGGQMTLSPISERVEGYRRALAQYGVPFAPELVRHGNLREGGGYAFTNEVLDLADPPTAILSLSNSTSLGVLRAVRSRLFQVPAQLSIIGFDDLTASELLEPPLCVVSQPTYDLGARAAELLIRRLSEPDEPVREVSLASTLIIRGSTGPAPARNSIMASARADRV